VADTAYADLQAEPGVALKPYTTLKAGGPAEFLVRAWSADEFASIAVRAQSQALPTTYLGWGSNVLPSDDGVPGLVILNLAQRIEADRSGTVTADAGCGFQELFLKSAQAGLGGLSFAVGIPGTLGGALVSNAGAYRNSIADFIRRVEVVFEGKRQWVEPPFLEFSYRDSILRRPEPPPLALVRVELSLAHRDPKSIYDDAREFQRQRILKQPPPASAGSFFKNVADKTLAETLPGLTDGMRSSGVVPSGYLIEAAGLKGHRLGGAVLGPRHANFIVNVGGASAFDIRRLAELAKSRVREKFGVTMEEEVLYLGDWTKFESG
jgi:UDP-N-acetylmuramate dehydrogenase